MVNIFKRVIFLFVLLIPTKAWNPLDVVTAVADAVVPEHECPLSTWTEWDEQGTCGRVTRTRSYNYYMCEFEILRKHLSCEIFLKPELPALTG